MSEAEAFLQAIRADPDDDAVRLVFADWLEEREGSAWSVGHEPVPSRERADFIRVQVMLSQLPMHDSRRPEWRERESQLFSRHEAMIRSELPEWMRDRAIYERGFAFAFHLTGWEWLNRKGDLLRRFPIQRVILQAAMPNLFPIFADADWEFIRELDLSGYGLNVAGVEQLALCERLVVLRRLDLSYNQIDDAALIAFTQSRFLSRLESIDLASNQLTTMMPLVLLASQVPRLRHLGMRDNSLGDRGMLEIARLARPSPLTSLDLSGNRIRERGVEVLADSVFVGELVQLDMSRNSIRNEGAIALARSRHLKKLEALTLWDCDIENQGAKALRERFGDRVVF